MLAAAAGLGLLIGVVIGGLGGGGGVLTVPLLVYVLGQSAQDAITSSVVIVGITAAAGALTRSRSHPTDWRTGLVFGALGVPSAYLGTLLTRNVAEHVVLSAFAALTLIAAVVMLLKSRAQPDPAGLAAGSPPGCTTVLARARSRPRLSTVAEVVACALAVGFLTGFLGVGGGFIVVPALVIVLRMPMVLAIGTSLMIIAVNSASSMVSRVGVAEFDWAILVPFTIAAVAGTFLGRRFADRLSGPTLTRAFAVLLAVVGVFVAVQSIVSA